MKEENLKKVVLIKAVGLKAINANIVSRVIL